MPPKKYRLNTVTVEGFGGFTEPQQVKISQKHTFVFGPNGHGKSSVLEAIRWCLFGQANSALRLVPYFVFSEFQQEALELELLLIDDPSQSFDTSHVGILLEELKKIASRTQLIIASHEREKFEPALDKHFSKQDMQILGVEAFDPVRGPTIAYSH